MVLSLLPSTVGGSLPLHDNYSQEAASSKATRREKGEEEKGGMKREEEKGGMKGEGERRMCVFMCVEGGGREKRRREVEEGESYLQRNCYCSLSFP